MFLGLLDNNEKSAFLELAHYIARCDNNFSQQEKEIIERYCAEMQIDDIEFDEEQFDIYNTLAKVTTRQSKNIIVLEIMVLIYADNFLHEEERKVLEKVLEEFDLSYHLATVYGEWAKAMMALYVQGNALINL